MSMLPTGTCFDDTVEYMLKAPSPDAVLVHTICSSNATSPPFVHAWVEHADMIFTCGLYNGEKVFFGVNKFDFRGRLSIRYEVRYTFQQMTQHLLSTLTSGPWDHEVNAIIDARKGTTPTMVAMGVLNASIFRP